MLLFGECLHVQCQIHLNGIMRNHWDIRIAETVLVVIRFLYALYILSECPWVSPQVHFYRISRFVDH
jgi:hypothetical protein